MNRNKVFFKSFALVVGITIISSVFAACAKRQGKSQTGNVAQTNETTNAEVSTPIPSEKFSREKFAESLSQFISKKQSQSRPQSLAEEESADEARLQTAQKLLDWTNESSEEEFTKWFSALKGGVYDARKLQENDIKNIVREYDFQREYARLELEKNAIEMRVGRWYRELDIFEQEIEKGKIAKNQIENLKREQEEDNETAKELENEFYAKCEKLKAEHPDFYESYNSHENLCDKISKNISTTLKLYNEKLNELYKKVN